MRVFTTSIILGSPPRCNPQPTFKTRKGEILTCNPKKLTDKDFMFVVSSTKSGMRAGWCMAVGVLAFAFGAKEVRAINYYGVDNGTGQTTAPVDGAWWNYVGSVGGGSGIYLGQYNGSYWAMTAAHVGKGTLTINSVSYAATADNAVQIFNPDKTPADMVLFKLQNGPVLPNLTLSSSAPLNQTVYMVGRGISRSTLESREGLQYWDSKWDTTAAPGTYSGYYVDGPKTMRWAENTLEVGYEIAESLGSPWKTYSRFTDFDALEGEGQAASGDSGGAMFWKNGSDWELSGLIIGIRRDHPGQPSDIAAVGDLTFAADIAYYRDTILASVPEPADYAGIAGGSLLLFALVRQRRSTSHGLRSSVDSH